jgi:drug/metabolite transporter (DMT)-like permease
LLFNEIIKISTIVGASLIIPSALLIAYYEINQTKKSAKKKAVELVEEEILEPEV